jgi:O-antigen/teichoic acid export membrane protein
VFVCLLQAAVAAPMIQTLFRPKDDPMKWVPAVPVLQIISLGMALQIFNMPAQSLIQAQGRFGTLLKFAIFCPILFFALIWTASMCGVGGAGEIRVAWLGRLLDAAFRQHVNVASVVACAVVIYCLITGPLCLWIAIRPLGGTWREIWPIYFWPVLTSSVAIFVGMLAGTPLPHNLTGNWAKLLLVPAVSGVCYVPLVRWTAPRAWADLVSRLSRHK